MPRKREGTAIPHDGHWDVRITLNDGTRPVICLRDEPDGRSKALARMRARSLTELARTGNAYLPDGSALAERGDRTLSMDDWFDEWIKARVAKGYTSTRENQSHYREHVVRVLAAKHVRDWTADDMRALSRALDEKVRAGTIKWKTASNIWGTATKMCTDAVSSKVDALRVRSDNPATNVAGPDRGAKTAKQYLYPIEFSRFVSCEEVPLLWRRIVALMVYLYPRPGELRELRWEDVDLEHGTIHIHQATDRTTKLAKATKTDRARRYSIEPRLFPLLKAMHEARGENPRVIDLPCDRDLARGFRLWLTRAKVNRAELHTSTPTRKNITVYDLRATGITWCAIRGDEPLRIKQRAGHKRFDTTEGYIREAEAVREGFGAVFPALPIGLLGTRPGPTKAPINRDSSDESSEIRPHVAKRRGNFAERAGFEPAAGF